MEHKIPRAVIDAASDLTAVYGEDFKYIGIYNGCEVYSFVFPENTETGFPFIYLYSRGQTVDEITGFDALDIIRSLVKD